MKEHNIQFNLQTYTCFTVIHMYCIQYIICMYACIYLSDDDILNILVALPDHSAAKSTRPDEECGILSFVPLSPPLIVDDQPQPVQYEIVESSTQRGKKNLSQKPAKTNIGVAEVVR